MIGGFGCHIASGVVPRTQLIFAELSAHTCFPVLEGTEPASGHGDPENCMQLPGVLLTQRSQFSVSQ